MIFSMIELLNKFMINYTTKQVNSILTQQTFSLDGDLNEDYDLCLPNSNLDKDNIS